MLYKEVAAKGEVGRYVKCFWRLEHDYRDELHTHEHLWADAYGELIFTSGEPYYLKTGSRRETLPQSFVIGPFKRKLMLYSDGVTRLVAVRFQPWGFYPFVTRSQASLVDRVALVEDVLGRESADLQRRLLDEGDGDRQLALLQEHFERRLAAGGRRPASIEAALHIVQGHGLVSIREVSRVCGVPPRRMQRVFGNEIGLSPKLLSRIVRFNYARQLIARDPAAPLSQVAFETGYSDQAHFSKNFREMFDISPADFQEQLRRFRARSSSGQIDVAFLQDDETGTRLT